MRPVNLFISHYHKFGSQHTALVRLLRSQDGFVFRDYSLTSAQHVDLTSTQIEQFIKRRLTLVSVVLVIGGRYAPNRPWIMSEIEWAQERGKRLLGVRQPKQGYIPDEVFTQMDAVSPWDGRKLVKQILKLRGS